MGKMNFYGEDVYFIDVEASPSLGFNFPFKIIIPQKLCVNLVVIYACNLPKDVTDECMTINEMIDVIREDYGSIDPVINYLSLVKGNPMVIPFVPTLRGFRPNFLGNDSLRNEFKLAKSDEKFKCDMDLYKNLALQHKNMVKTAIAVLKENGIKVGDKVTVCGYSEGAKFASHFSLLHPEMINSVIAGGTGGVMSMPLTSIDGYVFNYPTGIADLDKFNHDAFKQISFFYYMGSDDKSDSAIPYFEDYHYINENGEDCVLIDECGNRTPYIDEDGNQVFVLDENGNYRARFNLFSDEEVNAINKVLGTVTQKRFVRQKEIYDSLGLSSVFKIYPGNHRTIFKYRDSIFKDIDNFFDEKRMRATESSKYVK